MQFFGSLCRNSNSHSAGRRAELSIQLSVFDSTRVAPDFDLRLGVERSEATGATGVLPQRQACQFDKNQSVKRSSSVR